MQLPSSVGLGQDAFQASSPSRNCSSSSADVPRSAARAEAALSPRGNANRQARAADLTPRDYFLVIAGKSGVQAVAGSNPVSRSDCAGHFGPFVVNEGIGGWHLVWLPHDGPDGDGIADDKDACPSEPEDFDGFEDQDGCPDPDTDARGPRRSVRAQSARAGRGPGGGGAAIPHRARRPRPRDPTGIAPGQSHSSNVGRRARRRARQASRRHSRPGRLLIAVRSTGRCPIGSAGRRARRPRSVGRARSSGRGAGR